MNKYYTEDYDFRAGGEFYRIFDEDGKQVKVTRQRPTDLILAHRAGTVYESLHYDDITYRVGDVVLVGEISEGTRQDMHNFARRLI